ncbi:MAG: bifunctional riboflavin kinase/FAD synthetase [Clostridia bacterium]|nr:bifunctional riboflavin kinase/FAD synthetase [Clostridia bacterium]
MDILTERRFGKACAVVIGKFDGVHTGHKRLLNLTADICKNENLIPVAYTFESRGDCIISENEKIRILSENGIEAVFVQPFTVEFKNTTPEEFVNMLKDDFTARHIIIGFNFRFGKGRCGSAEDMVSLCNSAGIGVTVAEPVIYENEPVSSTRIRDSIRNGNIPSANEMLGRMFSISGIVVHGKQLGRKMGFPTANIDTADISVLPEKGVYATVVDSYPAITNIGLNPTVDTDGMVKAETHIMGDTVPDYGEEITVHFLEKIRDEKTFSDIEELKSQLDKDKQTAIEIYEKSVRN